MEVKIGYVRKNKSKLNGVGMSFLRNICGTTRTERAKNEGTMNGCGLNTEVSDPYERSILRQFGLIERMNEDQIIKHTCVRVRGHTHAQYVYIQYIYTYT